MDCWLKEGTLKKTVVSKSAVGSNDEVADESTITNQESCEIIREHDDTDLNMIGSSSLPSFKKKLKYNSYISMGFKKVGSVDAPDTNCGMP